MTPLEVATPALATRSIGLSVRITRFFCCQQGKARLPDRNWAWMSQGLTPPATATMQAKIKVIKIFNECMYVCTRLDQDYSWPPMSYVHVRACMRNFHRHASKLKIIKTSGLVRTHPCPTGFHLGVRLCPGSNARSVRELSKPRSKPLSLWRAIKRAA